MLEGRVILAHDVTERKNVAEELRQTNAALEAEIAAKERLQAQLEEQAMRDPLTGAFNRRYLAEALDGEVARSQREGLPLSVMILDVDRFKQFNDQYGHRCGDVVLMALAEMLRHDSRRSDIVCRYGGEEFVIALFNTPLDAAVARAEHWREMFEGLIVAYEGRQLNCTFSAGVASLRLHGSDGESILQAADQALYRSKAEGRNRVTVYGQPMREIHEDPQ
jgi:diguanylate cyclase (GGDEF)-like protein